MTDKGLREEGTDVTACKSARAWNRFAVALPVLAALALAACSSAGSSQGTASTNSVTTISISVIPNSQSDYELPLYAAQDLGLTKANGIKFNFVQSASGSALVTGLVAGAADYTVLPVISASEAIKQGTAIEPFATAGPESGGFFLDSKAGSGITNISQLAGKSICVSSLGSSTGLYAAYTNVSNNLHATLVSVGSAGKEAALLSGKAAACVEAAPSSYQLAAESKVTPLVNYGTQAPIFGAWVARSGYAQAHRAITEALLKCWYGAIKEMQAQPSLALKEFAKWNHESATIATQQYDADIKTSPTTGALTLAMVNQTYNVAKAAGQSSMLVPAAQMATSEFASISG
jgi:ABC-type nitrate/sulfonate/bicarbonate transport system substrate-binding protein